MSRPAEAILDEAMSLLPSGWAWPERDGGSVLAALLEPFAQEFADFEQLAEQCFEQIDPRNATSCLTDFERVLGPDPCRGDTAGLPLALRQQSAHQRWIARGGASVAYFKQVAASYGATIEITDYTTSQADWLRVGDELVGPPCQFVWRINLPNVIDEQQFCASASVAGDRLYDFTISDLECVLRRLKPAHTDILFTYGA